MKKVLLSAMMALTFSLWAQDNTQPSDAFQNYLSKIPSAPNSPSSYEFNRYGNIGLSEYTGTPNISIPIYTIQEGEISIPIQLSYQGGGIRVNQEASWVGLGWDINFGGIYQSINDVDDLIAGTVPGGFQKLRPDFANANPAMLNPYPWPANLIAGSSTGVMVGDPYPQTSISNNASIMKSYDYFFPLNGLFARNPNLFTSQNYDSEPDFFTANFLGHKIDFIFDFNSGNVKILNQKGYKVELIADSEDDTYIIGYDFIITVPSGIKFYFEKDERIKRHLSNPSPGTMHKIRSRAWKITKIEDTYGNSVEITYENIPEVINTPNYSQTYTQNLFTRTFNSCCSPNVIVNGKEFDFYGGPNPYETYVPHTQDATKLATYYDITKQNVLVPKTITWSGGTIDFTLSSRIDRPNAKKLDKITLNNGISDIKIFDFAYDYFGTQAGYNIIYNSHSSYNVQFNNRLKLLSVIEDGTKEHSFTYNSTNLPPKNTTSVDYWGFFNGSNNISLVPNPTDLQPTSAFNLLSNGNNKNASLQHAKAAVLERIDFPTKGFIEFEYELNTANNFIITTSNDTSRLPIEGSGLRLKKQTSYSAPNVVASSTEYEYFEGKSLLPKVLQQKYSVHHGLNLFAQMDSGSGNSVLYYYNLATIFQTNSNNMISLGSFSGDDFVGYGKVVSKQVSNGISNGKTINYYHNVPSYAPIIADGKYHGIPQRKAKEKDNGSLLTSEVYDAADEMLLKNEYSYVYQSSLMDYGVKIGNAGVICYHTVGGGSSPVPNSNLGVKAINLMAFYPIYSGKTLSISRQTTQYLDGGNAQTREDYTFDSLNRLRRQETSQLSDNERSTISYTYNSDPDFVTANKLLSHTKITQGIISPLQGFTETKRLEISYEKDNSTNNLLIKDLSDCTSLTLGNECKKTDFDKYDDRGNIVQYTVQNQHSTVVLWGYNKQYKIAQIVNATLQDITTALGISENTLLSYNENNFTPINSLRGLLPDARVTTYEYIPLVGISSITDSRNRKTTYHYDNLNRLEYVKDHDGNVLSKNEYHYKN